MAQLILSKINKIVVLVILVIAVLFGVLIFIYSFFQVKKITIISDVGQLYGLSKYDGQNILLINEKKENVYLLSQNPNFKNINMSKKLPHEIYIETIARKPVAQVLVGDKKVLIDDDGYLTASRSSTLNQELIAITMKRNPIISGYQADALVKKAIRYSLELKKNELEIKNIELDDEKGAYTITLSNQLKLLVPYSENEQVISSSLQLILARFRIEGKHVTNVNFLFDKPVITIANE